MMYDQASPSYDDLAVLQRYTASHRPTSQQTGEGLSMATQDNMITLLISCPDRPGIVAAISSFIFEHHGNICQSDQHSTDPHYGTFFMRVSFTEDSFTLKQADLVRDFTPIAEMLHMNWSVHSSRQRR
jgi:formyltetrahydrofolate deformylase